MQGFTAALGQRGKKRQDRDQDKIRLLGGGSHEIVLDRLTGATYADAYEAYSAIEESAKREAKRNTIGADERARWVAHRVEQRLTRLHDTSPDGVLAQVHAARRGNRAQRRGQGPAPEGVMKPWTRDQKDKRNAKRRVARQSRRNHR